MDGDKGRAVGASGRESAEVLRLKGVRLKESRLESDILKASTFSLYPFSLQPGFMV